MSLVSFHFFLFVFILLSVYYIVPRKCQWIVLLIGSCIFYLVGNWKLVGYILTTIITLYILAIKLDGINEVMNEEIDNYLSDNVSKDIIKSKYTRQKKRLLLLAIFIIFGLLIFVKYINFIISNINVIASGFNSSFHISQLNLIIPLGISFYTFQSVGYVIDVYRGKDRAEKNIFKLALFVSFFPTIVQGPIERHNHLADQLYKEHQFDQKKLSFGLQRMLWGYIQKLVIADRAVIVTNEIFNNFSTNDYKGFIIFIGGLLVGIQVYADFAGGMNIIIGLSEAMGIELTENFCRPYMAKSVSEFWQRWHITLGAWFKNYLFYPISLSKRFNKLGQKLRPKLGRTAKYVPPTLASFIVFMIIGIWHGAKWKYVAYGIWNAFFVSSGTLLADHYAAARHKLHIDDKSSNWQLFQILRTVFIVTIGRIISNAQNVHQALYMIKAMFSEFNLWVFFDGTLFKLGLNEKNFRFLIYSIVILFIVDTLKEKGIHIREIIAGYWLPIRWIIIYAAIIFVIVFGMYGPGYNANDFVYMHF